MLTRNDNRGFSVVGLLLFIVLVAGAVTVLTAMIRDISRSGRARIAEFRAVELAKGRIEEVRGMAFDDVVAAPFANADGEMKGYACETRVSYVNGPSAPDAASGVPTPYKKVTVSVSLAGRPLAELSCIRTRRQ